MPKLAIGPLVFLWIVVFCGLPVALAHPTFHATITQDSRESIFGEALLRKFDNGSVITLQGGRSGALVLICLPKGVKVGTHKLDSWSGNYNGGTCREYGASFSSFRSKTGAPGSKFESIMTGTIELRTISPLSGTFSFEADGGLEGIVRVTGSFSSLAPVE